jgi:hypothetical protein
MEASSALDEMQSVDFCKLAHHYTLTSQVLCAKSSMYLRPFHSDQACWPRILHFNEELEGTSVATKLQCLPVKPCDPQTIKRSACFFLSMPKSLPRSISTYPTAASLCYVPFALQDLLLFTRNPFQDPW